MIITTTHGDMDDADLEKREGREDHNDHFIEWIEYWLGEELVHRSAHVTVTKGVFSDTLIGDFNG
jgi:desulfoferrodoxin (superoxide reductase-like protein)